MARGDKSSLMRMNSASNHSKTERQDLDLYVTPPRLVTELLDWCIAHPDICYLDGLQNFWEPAVGLRHISDAIVDYMKPSLRLNGYPKVPFIKESDIIDRGQEDIEIIDFLKYDGPKENRWIVTNPPYKFANDFYKKACESVTDGNWVWMFVKIQFLETSGRYEIFKQYRPHVILGCTRRVECGKDGVFASPIQEGGAAMYCWVGHHVGSKEDISVFDFINIVNLNK